MKKIIWANIAVMSLGVLFAAIIGFYILSIPTNVCPPTQQSVKVEKPLTDWKLFYDRVKDDENWSIGFIFGVSQNEIARNDAFMGSHQIYLVDGENWYLVDEGTTLRGCGPVLPVYHYIVPSRLNRRNLRPLSDETKFVVIGNIGAKLHDLTIIYRNAKTKEKEEVKIVLNQ
jgi:hypothetical protein